MTEAEEAAYNAEVHRLINEGMKCPLCDEPVHHIDGIEVGTGVMGTCRNGHSYFIDGRDNEEDDG